MNSKCFPFNCYLIVFLGIYCLCRHFNLFLSLKKHFALPKNDENCKEQRAELIMAKLHPYFQYQADLILRELARRSGYWGFYFCKLTVNHSKFSFKTHVKISLFNIYLYMYI